MGSRITVKQCPGAPKHLPLLTCLKLVMEHTEGLADAAAPGVGSMLEHKGQCSLGCTGCRVAVARLVGSKAMLRAR